MVERAHRSVASGATEYQSACLQKQLLCFIINMVSYEMLYGVLCANNNNEEEAGGKDAFPKQRDVQEV